MARKGQSRNVPRGYDGAVPSATPAEYASYYDDSSAPPRNGSRLLLPRDIIRDVGYTGVFNGLNQYARRAGVSPVALAEHMNSPESGALYASFAGSPEDAHETYERFVVGGFLSNFGSRNFGDVQSFEPSARGRPDERAVGRRIFESSSSVALPQHLGNEEYGLPPHLRDEEYSGDSPASYPLVAVDNDRTPGAVVFHTGDLVPGLARMKLGSAVLAAAHHLHQTMSDVPLENLVVQGLRANGEDVFGPALSVLNRDVLERSSAAAYYGASLDPRTRRFPVSGDGSAVTFNSQRFMQMASKHNKLLRHLQDNGVDPGIKPITVGHLYALGGTKEDGKPPPTGVRVLPRDAAITALSSHLADFTTMRHIANTIHHADEGQLRQFEENPDFQVFNEGNYTHTIRSFGQNNSRNEEFQNQLQSTNYADDGKFLQQRDESSPTGDYVLNVETFPDSNVDAKHPDAVEEHRAGRAIFNPETKLREDHYESARVHNRYVENFQEKNGRLPNVSGPQITRNAIKAKHKNMQAQAEARDQRQQDKEARQAARQQKAAEAEAAKKKAAQEAEAQGSNEPPTFRAVSWVHNDGSIRTRTFSKAQEKDDGPIKLLRGLRDRGAHYTQHTYTDDADLQAQVAAFTETSVDKSQQAAQQFKEVQAEIANKRKREAAAAENKTPKTGASKKPKTTKKTTQSEPPPKPGTPEHFLWTVDELNRRAAKSIGTGRTFAAVRNDPEHGTVIHLPNTYDQGVADHVQKMVKPHGYVVTRAQSAAEQSKERQRSLGVQEFKPKVLGRQFRNPGKSSPLPAME